MQNEIKNQGENCKLWVKIHQDVGVKYVRLGVNRAHVGVNEVGYSEVWVWAQVQILRVLGNVYMRRSVKKWFTFFARLTLNKSDFAFLTTPFDAESHGESIAFFQIRLPCMVMEISLIYWRALWNRLWAVLRKSFAKSRLPVALENLYRR